MAVSFGGACVHGLEFRGRGPRSVRRKKSVAGQDPKKKKKGKKKKRIGGSREL